MPDDPMFGQHLILVASSHPNAHAALFTIVIITKAGGFLPSGC
jgi:hypothetical protein